MVTIGVAVIGAGDPSAQILISSLLRHKLGNSAIFSIAAIWDANVKLARDFANFFSLPGSVCCLRSDDALTRSEVNIAAICGASPVTQPNLAAKAIHAGKHVLLVPGYPVAINFSAAIDLMEARSAYPALVCIVASGFYYMPAFSSLRSEIQREVSEKTSTDEISSNIRSISMSAICSPALLFSDHEWQADSLSGGGVLSQVGAPLLDSALGLLLQLPHHAGVCNLSDYRSTTVTVQGRTAQLLEDTELASNVGNLWPRTSEDACWVQIDIKRRLENSAKMPDYHQSVISLDILASNSLAEDDGDPLLNTTVLVDSKLRFRTDGYALWLSGKNNRKPLETSSNGESSTNSSANQPPILNFKPADFINDIHSPALKSSFASRPRSVLLESVKHCADLIASEFIKRATSNLGDSDIEILFSNVLQNLTQTHQVIDISMALATQKLIDSVRHSLLGSAVQLDPSTSKTNQISWSHCL